MMYQFDYLIDNNYESILQYVNQFTLGNEKIKHIKKVNHLQINGIYKDINAPLTKGDKLTIFLDEEERIKPFKAFLDIVYEDSNLLIINKRAGLAVHTDGAKYQDNTLANMVRYYYDKKNLNIPVWYLHRLDFDTTGLIIFVKDPLSMAKLSASLANHEIKRDYLALVSGVYKEDELIDKPIGRDRHVNGKYRVSETGKVAKTSVRVLKVFKRYTLVRLSLMTGRTHQIRVHMAYRGHPLLGDTLYGGSTTFIKRHALHSAYLTLNHPLTNKEITLYSDLAQDMKKLIKK